MKRNGLLRRMVGISSVEGVSEAWHFSRFVGRLSEPEGQWHLEEMFEALVHRIKLVFPELGRYVAVDGTAVRAWANQHGSQADPDARWGRREYRSAEGGPSEVALPGGGGGCRAGSLSVAGKLLDLGLRLGAQAANRGLLQRLRPT
ncbi:MAG: hypothetical protein GX131_02120 [candidate division WS1 bacterium]|nr:hypothetical protein [candidate division WS1 bacterium]